MITTTKIKQKYQIQFTQKLMEELDEKIDEIKNDRFLNIVNWYSIYRISELILKNLIGIKLRPLIVWNYITNISNQLKKA